MQITIDTPPLDSITADMEVTHDGQLWRAKLAHTAHEGWVPSSAAYAVWELLGPA